MTKLNTEYFYNKDKKLKKKWDNAKIKWKDSQKTLNDIYPYFRKKIENSLINFLKLKDVENYHLEYSLKNRFRIYYKNKHLISDIEFIYDKNTKKFVDFIITAPNFKLKSKIVLDNFSIISKVIKSLSKKELLLKKYNLFNQRFIKKTRELIKIHNKHLSKINQGPKSINAQIVKNEYLFLKTLLLKKEFSIFSDKIIHLPYYPREILNPTNLKVKLISPDLYKVIINCKPNKECPQGSYSFEMNMNLLDDLLYQLAVMGAIMFK
jgi:hypothetical protein